MVYRSNLRRMSHLLRVLISHGLAQAATICLRRWPALRQSLRVANLSGPQRLRVMIEDLGGTFIKFGQMLALQPDILPLEYCDALFSLLDRVSPFAFEQVEKTFVEDFGKSPREIFDSFETEPVATASIGQVHIAYLKGRKLAVKVQRPNVESDFRGDIRLMVAFMQLIKRLHLKMLYWMIEPTSEFVAWTDEELDYRREARYMRQHLHNTRENPNERVPEVLGELVSRRILTVEFLNGVNLLDYLRALEDSDEQVLDSLKSQGFEGHQFVHAILENFISDAYRFGMFHADLHPANLIILAGNCVGYVDFGITGVLSRYSRQNIISLTLALGRGDLEGMCESFFKISTLKSESDVAGFRSGMENLASHWYQLHGKDRRLTMNATLVMLDMLRLSHRTGIYPERDVVKYIRSAIAIDGLITRVAPEFDLGRNLELICHRHLKWQMRREAFTFNTIFGWANSGGRLMENGAFRASRVLSRMAAGETRAFPKIKNSTSKSSNDNRRMLRYAAVLFVVAVAMGATGSPRKFGINLLTVGVIFVLTAAITLVGRIRRPA